MKRRNFYSAILIEIQEQSPKRNRFKKKDLKS